MHQTYRTGITVAPLDKQPWWPDGYIAALRKAGAQEKTIPYCVAWVRQFFARYPGRRRRDLGRAEIEAFFAKTGQRAGMSNRQVQQARNAVELYYEQFRGIALAPRPNDLVSVSASPLSSSQSAKPAAVPKFSRILNTYIRWHGQAKQNHLPKRGGTDRIFAQISMPAQHHRSKAPIACLSPPPPS